MKKQRKYLEASFKLAYNGDLFLFCPPPGPPTDPEQGPHRVKECHAYLHSVFHFFLFMVAFVPIFILQVPWRVGVMNKYSVHSYRGADSISFQLSTPLTGWVEHKFHGLKKFCRLL